MGTRPSPEAFEAAVRQAVDAGDAERATTIVLRELGPEILGWLIERLRGETAGSDAFSWFAEDLWRSWSSFAWRCSARGWAYTLARNAANRQAVAARRDAGRQVPLERVAPLLQVVDQVRTETLLHLRTEVKDRFRALREQLSEEDQTILVLRVDRGLPWTEVAHVMLYDEGTPPTPAVLHRETARLRKRLQLIKEQVRALAQAAGLG